MKKILSLLALSCLGMGAWAQTVVARMSDLVKAGTNNGATVSSLWKASEGDVYEFSDEHFISGIENTTIKEAFGSKFVTVAAWVYGRPTGGCIFSYGGQSNGVKFKLTGTTMQTTTKSKADYPTQAVDAIAANGWNLVAFTINNTNNQTRYISGHQGHFGYFYTKNATAGMNVPAEADQKFAIGSGNQGNARETFTGMLANVTVITSDNWLDANAKVEELVGPAPSMKAPFTYASDLDHIGDAKWYKIKVKNQWAKYNPTKNTYDWTNTEPTDGTGYFAMVGKSTESLKIFNYANGMAIGSGNVNTNNVVRAVSADEAKTYKLLHFVKDEKEGWQFEDTSKANARLNHLNAGLGYWVYNAGYDEGNNVEFYEVEDLTAANYYEYNVTATGDNGNVTWKHAKFTNDTEASVSHIPAYDFISDYAITSTSGHSVVVSATSTMPVVAGKFYQLRNGSNYLSYTNEQNVSIRAAANNLLAKNLWYVQNCAYAPYIYLCNLENEKAVNVTSNGGNNIRFSNVLDATSYEGAMAALEVKTVSGGFKINRAASIYNLGSHGNNVHDGVDDGANSGLGGWNNGNTAFVPVEFDPTQFNINNTEEGFVGYITNFADFEPLKDAYTSNPGVATLKAALTGFATLDRIEIEEGKYYQITFRRGNQAFGNYGAWAGPAGTVSTEAASRTVTTADYATASVPAGLWQFENDANGKYLKTAQSGFYLANVDGGHLVTTLEKQYGKTFTFSNGNNTSTTWQMSENGKSGNNTINIYFNPGSNDSREVTYWQANDNGDYFTIKEVTEVPVTVKESKWASFCFPFAVTLPSTLTAYYAVEATAEGVGLEKIEGGIIPANTGVLVTGEAGTYNLTIGGTAAAVEGNLLVGTTVMRRGFADDAAGVCYGLSAGQFLHIVGNDIAANKAYYVSSAPAASTLRIYVGEGELTGIDSVEAAAQAGAYYDLNGRMVAYPTTGVYVHNGKKVFIK